MSNINYKCPHCERSTDIKLMPDFASSGLWCNSCGIGISDPGKDLFLPDYIVDLIEMWMDFWDLAIFNPPLTWNTDNAYILLESNGNYIVSLINKYCPCVLQLPKKRT